MELPLNKPATCSPEQKFIEQLRMLPYRNPDLQRLVESLTPPQPGFRLPDRPLLELNNPPDSNSNHWPPLAGRTLHVDFDAGCLSSDAGALLLAEVERLTGILQQFADCFTDHRDPELIEHTVPELLAQRIYALALGYEDLNDHDRLRLDPLLAALVGKLEPTGQDRLRDQDKGKPLAGKSTLNRLELTEPETAADDRYKKIVARQEAIDQFFLEIFFQGQPQAPTWIILDLDNTPDRIHGHQEGRFWHGHYRDYCYLPLYVFCGRELLCARLLTADSDLAAAGLTELKRLVAALRARWPQVQILVRGDGGFGGEDTMSWCEQNHVHYLFGYGENSRLLDLVGDDLFWAHVQYLQTGVPARLFGDLDYRTLTSWSRSRRVVYKAEYLPLGPNPRFVVTSLPASTHPASSLYERDYCGRGEMENRIKEQKLDLKSDRTSARSLRANQLRLCFASVAYLLLEKLRHWGLRGTQLASAQCGTIRSLLLKVGAVIQVTARTIRVSFSSSWPLQGLFQRVAQRLRGLARLAPTPSG